MTKLFSFFLCLCMANIVLADAPVSLSQFLDGIKTMRAEFTQTVFDNHNKPIQQASGQMALQRPGKFRWETRKPLPQLFIANGTRLWIYDPDLDQVVIRSLQQAAGETPALLLSHVSADITDSFVVKPIKKDNANWQWFLLTPKNQDNMFASVELGFSNQQLREMRLEDRLGHHTRIQFSDAQYNMPLAANLFIFKVPAHIDVIDETKQK
jgi:outer membrane lipoprotein carrier protein